MLVASTLTVGGCSLDVAQPDLTSWQADLQPILPAPETASVAVVSRSDRADTSIAMSGGEPGTTYRWGIRVGSCQAEGEAVGGPGLYPTLTANASGQAGVDAVLSRTLNPGTAYTAWLYRVEAEDGDVPVACGALQRVG
jgi:hypothetical protein